MQEKRKRRKHAKCDSITYTTGDIALNIDRFNKAMGTADCCTSLDTSESTTEAGGLSEGLTEAKRYVRRYYIRPQNIFCSNKHEIVKALIDLDGANCTVYTLNNLGDEKDVTKLMNSDIIYYYDDGILYDKNRIKVMDYDLSIKKEEERKHFANAEKAPEKEFKDAYEDRMTKATELEESVNDDVLMDTFYDCDYEVINAGYTDNNEIIVTLNHNVQDIDFAAEQLASCLEKAGIFTVDWNTNGSNVFSFELEPENAFDLAFESYNVFGEKLTESMHDGCCICGEPVEGYGNNPEPFMSSDEGVCCDACNLKFVIPARLAAMED